MNYKVTLKYKNVRSANYRWELRRIRSTYDARYRDIPRLLKRFLEFDIEKGIYYTCETYDLNVNKQNFIFIIVML